VWGLVEPKSHPDNPRVIEMLAVKMIEKIKLYNGRYQLEKVKELTVKKKLEILAIHCIQQ
jgi:hypothetical protein